MTPALLASALTLSPRPVVCLDTCTLFDLVRTMTGHPSRDHEAAIKSSDRPPSHARLVRDLEAAIKLTDAAVATPARAAVVVTDLVRLEWSQNLTKVAAGATVAVWQFYQVLDTAKALGRTLPPPPDFTTFPSLMVDLVLAASALLARGLTLDRDPACAGRAIDRVANKVRPAGESGEVKDALHLEHYLELSRMLGAAGAPPRRVFVSSDLKAFCVGSKDSPKLDPALAANDFGPAGLEFYVSLGDAVDALRI